MIKNPTRCHTRSDLAVFNRFFRNFLLFFFKMVVQVKYVIMKGFLFLLIGGYFYKVRHTWLPSSRGRSQSVSATSIHLHVLRHIIYPCLEASGNAQCTHRIKSKKKILNIGMRHGLLFKKVILRVLWMLYLDFCELWARLVQ